MSYQNLFEDIAESALRPRCVSDRDLHISIAEQLGWPLEDLDYAMKLKTVKLNDGPAFQIVSCKKHEKR